MADESGVDDKAVDSNNTGMPEALTGWTVDGNETEDC